MGHDWFHQDLLLLGLLWLSMLLYWAWLRGRSATSLTLPSPAKPIKKRTQQPKPFAGLLRKPLCGACEHTAESRPQAPCALPPRLPFRRGRYRTVDTQQQFGPDEDCSYYGWRGRGNIRANGHPGGQPWRQFPCVSCHGYFQETHGTPVHGKRVSPDMLIWAVGALAEGLGIRAVARVFAVDPNTVLAWLMAVADHAAAFSRYFLHDVRGTQVQLDELFAVLSWFPARHVVFIGDSRDGTSATARVCPQHRRHLPVVSKFYGAAAWYEPPPPRTRQTIGRPRVKGQKLAAPQEVVAPLTPGTRLTGAWYGGPTRALEFVTGTGHWSRLGEDVGAIRWGYVHEAPGTHRDESLFTTDLQMPPQQMVAC
jgi:hypothetical protein